MGGGVHETECIVELSFFTLKIKRTCIITANVNSSSIVNGGTFYMVVVIQVWVLTAPGVICPSLTNMLKNVIKRIFVILGENQELHGRWRHSIPPHCLLLLIKLGD